MRVATRESSARGRLGGRGCSEAAEADCPTKAGREVVGSVLAEGLRTTPSLARGGATRVIARHDDSRTRAITRPIRGKGENAYRSRSFQG